MQVVLEMQLVLVLPAATAHILRRGITRPRLESTSGMVHFPNAFTPIHAQIDDRASLRV